MLSVGATFAADNATDVVAIDDEVTIDEPLAVEQEVQDVSANESSAAVVTPETIGQYIDDSGQLYKNVTADEIVFNGTFDNLNLTVERAITLTGGFFNDPNFEIYSSDVILRNLSIIQNKGVNSIFVAGSEENHTSDVLIDNVNIVFADDQSGAGAIPIEVMYSDDFMFINSFIAYGGRTNGYYINNAVRITSSKNAIIFNNEIFANLVSAAVGWAEEPAGSGNWVSAPMSEAIVIKNSDGAILDGNLINVTYGNVTGDWDTIYTVDVSGSNDVLISNNEIISDGFSYIYGIIISGDDFTISGNNITSTSVLYANGIDIEGPATGVVENNNVDVSAVTSAYAIYSGMNGQKASANYTGNNITGKAYNIFGFSLGDVESNVKDNFVDLEGNYTTGLAARTGVLNVDGNRFVLTSSEEGNESVWEGFGVEARGILVITGNATIANNTIATNGKGVVLSGNGTSATLGGNFINVVGNADKDAYALYADELASLIVNNNTVDYQGTTNGTGVNNGVYVHNTTDARFTGNTFTLDLVSSYVPWLEIPTGSGNYVSFPVSEGIVFDSSEAVQFRENNVTVTYGDVVGSYDTIYAVDFKNSDYALIENNKINAKGHTYIYGIILSGNNFNINSNTIATESDNYYANGIDIEGPATGVVYDNTIDVTGKQSAYAIYSGMNGQNVSALYQNNTITGKGYNVFGMSLGDVESNVKDNSIILDGNYTTGIAYRGTNINATGNYIVLSSTEQGNLTVWENFGVEARGILVIAGNATIANNTIATPGKGVVLTGNETSATLEGNFINVVGNADKDAYALYADELASLIVNNNTVDYQGTTAGIGINNAVYVHNTTDARFTGNNFTLDLVSSYVPWPEVPEGSGNYVSAPISEGIVFDSSEAVQFRENNVTVTYGDVVGMYDTIYAVDFKNSDYALIENNKINAKGHTYIYGIILSGNNFNINSNTIATESDNYYANGIDIEGPATGVVYDNTIDVTGVESAYAIYSGMNGQNVSALYQNNTITGKGYNVFGMSLGDVESNVKDNSIILDGNYTTGIAYRGSGINATGNYIVLSSTEQGNLTVWENFGVEAVGIKVINGTAVIENNTIATPGKGIHIEGAETDAFVFDNFINVVGNDDQNAYAIFAIDAASLFLNLNNIDYQGATKGTGVNNAVYVNNVADTSIIANNFTLDLVSSYVPWFETPAGSGNWVSFPISEGIVIEDTDNPVFSLNKVDVTYGDVVGSHDTIYVVDVKADNAIISENEINAKGHTYIYGLIITGENFTVEANNITAESDNYYANGIDIEGPATGVVKDNGIIAKGANLAYPVYSGMNGQKVSVNYTGNDIVGDAYLVIGMSLGDVESNIADSGITVTGNYTTGIAYRGSKLTVDNTQISSKGSNIGNETVWEAFGTDTSGIKVVLGNSTITNNNIETTADYAVDVRGTAASVHDNLLLGKVYYGDASVANAENATVHDNGPLMNITTPVDFKIGDSANITIELPFANGNATVIYDGSASTVTFNDGLAVFTIDNVTDGLHSVVVIYQGNEAFSGIFNYSSFYAEQFGSQFVNITVNGDGFIDAVLVNSLGDPIANTTVIYKINGVEANVTTDENGWFIFRGASNAVIEIAYEGTDSVLPANLTINLQNVAPARTNTTIMSSDFTQYACDYSAGERGGNFTFQLVDEMGNPLANKTVYIGYNGITLNRTTDEKGYAAVQINLQNAGLYTFAIVFLGDEDYNATMAVHAININKKTTSISASAKTYKATAKTKKYTVTLKTIKGASVDGKTYLKAGKKVTMKINGKTYTAKTNAKGQATFSLKITKKGKFAATINYEGSNTYEASSAKVKITIK